MGYIRRTQSEPNLSRRTQKEETTSVQQKKPPETQTEQTKAQSIPQRRSPTSSILEEHSKLREGTSGFSDTPTKQKGPPGVALGVPPPPPNGPPPPPTGALPPPLPPPPKGLPPPPMGVKATSGSQTATVSAAKPLSEMGPDDKRVTISHTDFQKLMAGANDGQFKLLRERITQAATPAKQAITAPMGNPKGAPNFRLDIEGVPNRDRSGTEQLSVMFRKEGMNSVRMRAYQGEPSAETQNLAVLDVQFNSTDSKKSAHLDWVGKRQESTPCNLSGNTLMGTFAGLMKASGYEKGDLSDVSGLPIDRKQPDLGLVKLKVTGAYDKGKTWYMGFDKQFDVKGDTDPIKWRDSAELLSKTQVSSVLEDLGTQTKRVKLGEDGTVLNDDTDSSKMNLRQIVEHFTPKIIANSKDTLKENDVKNLRVAEFYGKMLETIDPEARPSKPDNTGTTTELRIAHDFYKIAMERDVAEDPNAKAKEAARYVRETSEFSFTVK